MLYASDIGIPFVLKLLQYGIYDLGAWAPFGHLRIHLSIEQFEVEPEQELEVGLGQLVIDFLGQMWVGHSFELLDFVIISGLEAIEAHILRVHVANAFMDVSKIDFLVITLIVHQEAQ